jgi:toxin HigB-1
MSPGSNRSALLEPVYKSEGIQFGADVGALERSIFSHSTKRNGIWWLRRFPEYFRPADNSDIQEIFRARVATVDQARARTITALSCGSAAARIHSRAAVVQGGGAQTLGILTYVSRHDTFCLMIVSFRGKLAEHAMTGRFGKGFPADLIKRTRAMLSALDAAHAIEDLRFPPGNHLEALSGDRSGQHSVRINGQWRICFIWTSQGPADVEIVDYH